MSRWGIVEDACLQTWWPAREPAEIAARLGCSEAEIERQARRLRLPRRSSPSVRAWRQSHARALAARRMAWLAALSTEEQRDYRFLRRNGYRRAEALRAIGREELA